MDDRATRPPAQGGVGAVVMFWIFATALFTVGGVLTVVDALLMALGANQMAPGESGHLMMLAAVAGAIFKAAWMTMAREYFMRRMFFLGAVSIISGAALHVFSMTAMTGLAATGRDVTLSGRGQQQEAKARAQVRYREASARLQSLSATRADTAIRADIVRAESDLTGAENDLTRSGWRDRPALRDRRDGKRARLDTLNAELAQAVTAIAAAAEVTAAKTDLDNIKAPEHRDAQAAAIARYPIGLSEDGVAMLLPLMPSLLVEWGGGVAWLFAGTFVGFALEAQARRRSSSEPPARTIKTMPKVRTVAVAVEADEIPKDQGTANVTLLRPETGAPRPATIEAGSARSRATPEEIAQLTPTVLRLSAEGRGERAIGEVVGLSKTAVHGILTKDRAGLSAGGLNEGKTQIGVTI